MLAFKFIGCGIELGNMGGAEAALDDLLFKVIVPITFYSDADAELWETDPHEYVRKTYDPMEDFTDPRMAAAELVCDLPKPGETDAKAYVFLRQLPQHLRRGTRRAEGKCKLRTMQAEGWHSGPLGKFA